MTVRPAPEGIRITEVGLRALAAAHLAAARKAIERTVRGVPVPV